MSQTAPPDAIAVTPVYRTGVQQPADEVSMVDVTVSAFHLTGLIMGGALAAGLIAGVAYVWFRKGRPVTTIEARGNNHNFLRE
ncbi:MAG: hypothetical protein KA371_07340 [Acidobacteria bacterium]|nr:hypothetical protein [Acidobacteriota bacterium]